MLPEKISNGLCSLNPDVDRLAMVCEMAIGAQGEVSGYEFYAAVFRSKARLTYTKVWAELSSGKAPAHLATLYEVFKALHRQRERRGAIDFETVETRMVFDPRGKIEKIVAETRNDAHRLIEECMLAANVCAGNFIAERDQPVLYRVHEVPAEDRVAALRDFLAELGLQLPGGAVPRPKDYAQLLERIRTRPDFLAAADDPAALAEAGGLHAAQRRPLRPRLRGLRALHLADPALPGPAGAPRDQGAAERRQVRRASTGRRSAATARRPSGAPTTRAATSRPG